MARVVQGMTVTEARAKDIMKDRGMVMTKAIYGGGRDHDPALDHHVDTDNVHVHELLMTMGRNGDVLDSMLST